MTIPCASQPFGFAPLVCGVDLEKETAPLAPDPCVMSAPPPSSLAPVAQLAVDVGVVVPTDGLPPVFVAVPTTTTVLPTTPLAPVAPDAPVGPVGPVAPIGPLGPTAPVGPVAPVAPFEPAAPVAPVAPSAPVAPVAPVWP